MTHSLTPHHNMTAAELITYKSHEVRKNSDLMASYIELFSKQFGYTPNCAGCTFKNDWQKFVRAVQVKETTTEISRKAMEKNFELKSPKREILTYKVDGRPFRTFSDRMTEEFAIAFLTHGTEEQINERKKLFKTLPKMDGVEDSEKALSDMTRKELDALAKEKGLNPSDFKKKNEVISALEDIQLEDEIKAEGED